MVANVNQIKIGTIINVNVNVKTIKHAMRIIVGILLHVSVRMVSIYGVLMIIQQLDVMELERLKVLYQQLLLELC